MAGAWERDAVELTRDIIRIDSTNGHETAVARHLAEYLSDAGVESELFGPDPERLNLVARIPGRGGPSLGLVGHSDVVPADVRDWDVPPFEGVIDDAGYLWGRGAVDMKNEVAARAVAMASLAREGFAPSGDLILLVVADEEDGSAWCGMNWVVRNRPDLAMDMAINEGGGLRYELADGRLFSGISVGEKGTNPVRVEVRGEAGHASMPTIGDNPMPRLGEVLTRLGVGGVDAVGHPVTTAMLDALLWHGATEELGVAGAVERAVPLHPIFKHTLPALSGTTLAPTMLCGSSAPNVIPGRVHVDLDCRVLPGTPPESVFESVRRRIGDLDVHLSQPLPEVQGNASNPVGPLWDAISRYATVELGQTLLPMLCAGFTDSVYLRETFGTQAYGFSPFASTPTEVIEAGYHNRNERVHVDDLVLATDFHRGLAKALLG